MIIRYLGLPSYLYRTIVCSESERSQQKQEQGWHLRANFCDPSDHRVCVQASFYLDHMFLLTNSWKTYIALSKKWGSVAGNFYLDDFYDNIVSMFEDNADDAWAEETLEW